MEQPWANSANPSFNAAVFVISSEKGKTIVRDHRKGIKKEVIENNAVLHPGWNSIDIRTWKDSNSHRIYFWQDGKTVGVVEYKGLEDLSWISVGVIEHEQNTYFSGMQLSNSLYEQYGDFGPGKAFNFFTSGAGSAITLDSTLTSFSSPSSGYVGNTAAEENAWGADGLAWYSLHIPGAANYLPQAKCFAYHSITTSKSLEKCGLKSQTVYDDFRLENHFREHPGYAAATLSSLTSAQQAFIVKGQSVPPEFTSNTNGLYTWMMQQVVPGTSFFKQLKDKPDWGQGGDSLMRGALYLHQANKQAELQSLFSSYPKDLPNRVSHIASPARPNGMEYIQNGVMAGEVLAPMLITSSCPGVPITNVSGTCNNSGYTTTLTWSPVVDAKEYYIAVDDDTNFWQSESQETGERVRVYSSTTTTWSQTFTTNNMRYYQVRVSKADTCIPSEAGFGSVASLNKLTCSPGISPTTSKPSPKPNVPATFTPTPVPAPIDSNLTKAKRIVIRAKGIKYEGVWPQLELQIKNAQGVYQPVHRFSVGNTQYRNFSYTHNAAFDASKVRIAFVNDKGPRDVYVDFIRIGSKRYQTEASTTYSTGTWNYATKRCDGHYPSSEALHCYGYFEFFKQ